jgi:predicted DNA-binding ribbon-helix-helix protein
LRTQAQISIAATERPVRESALRQILVAVDRSTRLVRQFWHSLNSIQRERRSSSPKSTSVRYCRRSSRSFRPRTRMRG